VKLRRLRERSYLLRLAPFSFALEQITGLAGVPGRLVHDLRRTAARDFRRAGVSEGEIMKLCGWKTRDMFDRYNIIDSSDLSRAVAQRFDSKLTASISEKVEQPN
jgi:integrase